LDPMKTEVRDVISLDVFRLIEFRVGKSGKGSGLDMRHWSKLDSGA
jgi:hypothetical protein